MVVCAGYRDPIIVRFGVHAALGPERVLRMAHWSSGGLVPDVFLLVDDATDDGAAYQDLAASAPERYLRVTPLTDGDLLPEDVLDQLAALLRKHSPRRSDEAAEADGGVVPVSAGDEVEADGGVIAMPAGDDEAEDSVIPDGIR
jgi:hypothetical protein